MLIKKYMKLFSVKFKISNLELAEKYEIFTI